MLYCNSLLQSMGRTNANDVLFITQRQHSKALCLEQDWKEKYLWVKQ